jgi:RNA polymerase sigma factor (sigma-70 family)
VRKAQAEAAAKDGFAVGTRRARLFGVPDGDCEDVGQETSIAVYGPVYAGEVRHVPGFIRGVARNMVANYWRRSARKVSTQGFPEDEAVLAKILREDINELEDIGRREALEKAAGFLTPSQFRVFYVHIVDGADYKEIAEMMHGNPHTVRKHLQDAKKRLQAQAKKGAFREFTA